MNSSVQDVEVDFGSGTDMRVPLWISHPSMDYGVTDCQPDIRLSWPLRIRGRRQKLHTYALLVMRRMLHEHQMTEWTNLSHRDDGQLGVFHLPNAFSSTIHVKQYDFFMEPSGWNCLIIRDTNTIKWWNSHTTRPFFICLNGNGNLKGWSDLCQLGVDPC